jgi:hypothetical protein
MTKYLCCLLASLFSLAAQAQVFQVSGKVTDKQTGQPLSGASVVCQSTTIGTTTNAEGLFTLTLPQGGYDLAFTYSGYETQSFRINGQTENLRSLAVEMKQKEKSMEEVSITVSNEVKDGWDKYGAFFRDQFLGQTPNSARCRIENPEALKFYFNKKKNRLKVTAKEDIRIQNQALGYTIRYQLDSFVHEYASGATLYTGFPFFEEMTGTPEAQKEWASNRETAYYGSMLHFMRCYYDSTLGENGYKVERLDAKTEKPRLLRDPYDSAVFSMDENREAEIRLPGKIRVVYSQEKPEAAYLSLNKLSLQTTVQVSIVELPERVVIEENGYYYDQREILALGYWGWEKIGEILPYNYEPEGD